MWKLTIQDDQGTETQVHLVRDSYTIGRSEENSVRLTERNVSRRHARIALVDGSWSLYDLSSYNGCYVNGARVAESQNLAPGDLIQLGDYRLIVEDESMALSRANGTLTLPGRPGMNVQSDRLVMVVGPAQGQEFVLAGERVVLGRGEECEVSINHPSVSRVHAEIRPVGGGRYEVVDLGSANGVRVNGVELPSSLLDARDAIELGDVVLKFVPAGELYVPGNDETQRPPSVSDGPVPRFSTGMKLAMAAGGAAVLAVVVLVLALGGSEAPREPLVQSADDGVAKILAEARALLDRGNTDAAVKRASKIPTGSNLRESADFKAIHAAWADELFKKAAALSEPGEKRLLLDQIARSPAVDPTRRKRAAAELEAIRHAAVEVADLPSDEGISVEATEEGGPDAAEGGDAPKAPKKVVTGGKPAAPAGKPPATKPTAKPPSGATLVRQNPFDDP